MLPERISNPGPQTYEACALPIALRGPATKENNSVNNVGGVMDLIFCMPSDDVLYSYHVKQIA